MSAVAVAARVDAAVPAAYRIASRRAETHDTVTLELAPLGRPLRRFQPGQFAMLTAYGVGEVPISLSGLRGDHLVHTIRAVGAVTRVLCGGAPGAVIGVRGPFGTAWDLDMAGGRDVIVVAGGIGLAPLRPVVRQILSGRSRCGRVAVLAGARTPAEFLYPAELGRWAGSSDVLLTVDRPDHTWRGRVGLVTTLIPDAGVDPAGSAAFVCGPEIMLRSTVDALLARGVPGERIQVSLERSMRCGTGWCGHCQLGPLLVCRDGPVVPSPVAVPLLRVREL